MANVQTIGVAQTLDIDLWNLPTSGLTTVSSSTGTDGVINLVAGLRRVPIIETFVIDPETGTPTAPILSQGTEQTPIIIINYTTRVIDVVNVSATNSDYFYAVLGKISAKGEIENNIAGLLSKYSDIFSTHDAIVVLDMIDNPKKWAFVTVKNVEIFIKDLAFKRVGLASKDYPKILAEQQNLVWASLTETEKVLYIAYFLKWGVRQSVEIPKTPILILDPTFPVTVTPPYTPIVPPTTGVGSGTGGVPTPTPEPEKTTLEKFKEWAQTNKKSLQIGGGVVAGLVVLTQIVPKNEK